MVHCFQNNWFNKRTYPNEHRNGHQLSTKWALGGDQSSVRSWPTTTTLQPIGHSEGVPEVAMHKLGNWLMSQLCNLCMGIPRIYNLIFLNSVYGCVHFLYAMIHCWCFWLFVKRFM